MGKKKIPWIEITALSTVLLLVIAVIRFHKELFSLLESLGKFFLEFLKIFLLILLFKIPIYFILLLFLLIFFIRFSIRRYKRREFIDVRDGILFQIFQLGEIGTKDLMYEYIEILDSGYGYEINDEILPKDKDLEFKNIIADLLNKNLIKSDASSGSTGKLYKLTEKGFKYARRKKWKVP